MKDHEIIRAFKELPDDYIKEGMDWVHTEDSVFVTHPDFTPMQYLAGKWKEVECSS